MTDYDVNESAMRDGAPEPGPLRICCYCWHYHPGAGDHGICDAGFDKLPEWNADVVAECVVHEDTAACSEWRECE